MALWANLVKSASSKDVSFCQFDSDQGYMIKNVAFKTIMNEPIIIDGNGDIGRLSEIIGENNVERLIGLDVIKEDNGSFEVTDLGKKFVEIFNR